MAKGVRGFRHGDKKPENSGRKKGTPNKIVKEAKEVFKETMEGQMSNVQESLEIVRKQDHLKYLEVLAKYVPFFMPKKYDVKSDDKPLIPDYSGLTFEQLYELKHGRKPDKE